MLLSCCRETKLAVALLGLLIAGFWTPLAAQPVGDPTRPQRFATARSWGYQLQDIVPRRLAAAPHDVLVIDYAKDGTEDTLLKPADLLAMKLKPDGQRRIVLAYMSIGEAEAYRYYWKWTWGGSWYGTLASFFFAPAWLGPENADWGGNFAVRYWLDSWQQIIIGDGGYLERIVNAGFDGVYLDKVDSSIESIAKRRPTAKADMRTFVARIAERGRQLSPGFLVVPQNGEELLDDPGYVAVISGLAKEDLLFGEIKEKTANPAPVIARRTAQIEQLRAVGKPVLAVEYLDDPTVIASARQSLIRLGYIAHFADRELTHMRFADVPEAVASKTRKGRRRWFRPTRD